MAFSKCPLGSYVKTGRLTIRVTPGGRLVCVSGVLQPFRLVNSSELSRRAVPVTESLRTPAMDSKASPPVFCNASSAHQPVPAQLSKAPALKDALKLGARVAVGVGVDVGEGVDVGVEEGVEVGEDVGVGEGEGVDVIVGVAVGVDEAGVDVGVKGGVGVWVGVNAGALVLVGVKVRVGIGVRVRVRVGVGVSEAVGVLVGVGVGGTLNTGTTLGSPVRVAFCPEIQQVSPARSGLRITQKFPSGLRPTTSAVSPICTTPTWS